MTRHRSSIDSHDDRRAPPLPALEIDQAARIPEYLAGWTTA